LVHYNQTYDKELNKQRLRRFSRLTMTRRELLAEIAELENLVALMRTYPDSPQRQKLVQRIPRICPSET